MKYVVLLITIMQISNTENFTINFGKNGEENWYIVNDVVMGGRSTGTINIAKKALNFSGYLSLENNGGFASIRSPYQNYDLSDYDKVKIRYKSTGKQFAFTLELSEQWYQPYYKFYLDTTGNTWQEVEIDLKNFEGQEIGKPTGKTITQNQLNKIIRLGFITTDKNAGQFELLIDYIHFF